MNVPDLVRPTVRIVLHGRLRRKFGAEFNLGVSSAAAAVNALMILVKGFREELEKGQYRIRRGTMRDGHDLTLPRLGIRIVPGGEMHIIPVAAGGGGRGGSVGKIIVGALLVVASVALMQPEIGGALGLVPAAGAEGLGFGTSLIGGFTIGNLALMGGAMILTGITQLISPQPKASSNAGSTASFLISGLNNVVIQGVPVPVVYGRMRVGSVVVSLGYSAEEFSPYAYYLIPNSGPGVGFQVPVYGGTTPSGGATEAAGTSGPVNSEEGSSVIANNPSESGGGGGGKGGAASGGGANEAPDTLFSKATVRIIDVLSEGPIGGLVDGAKSIFFNGTPLQAADGSYNFKGVGWEVRYGAPDQDPISGFPASETSIQINQRVQNGSPVVRTISSTSATAARVTVMMPAMFSRNASTGEVTAAPELHYKIEVRPSQAGSPGWEGSWVTIFDIRIQGGKCMSPYQRSHRFDLPLENGANTWDIRVTRLSLDSHDVANLQFDLYFDIVDVIDDHQLIYPNTAYIALVFDSRAFGSNIPTRQYEIYGRTIAVSLNYDPGSRTYASIGAGTTGGTWDLVSTHSLPSDNTAFVLLDMMSNSRYGCGISGNYLETVRADLYNIAQYCDGSVPDGYGGYEPRYATNVVIANQDEAYRLLQMMVGAFRGMTYWGPGQVVVTADMPADPIKVVNQTNVIDGDFGYEGTSATMRHNLVRVAYNDKSNQYLPAYELVSDTFDIAQRGAVPTDIVAWGCTSRSLAHRLGKWLIYTEKMQSETVSYKTGLRQADLRPNDKIKLSDSFYVGARMAGRLKRSPTPPGANLLTDSVTPLLTATSPNSVALSQAVSSPFYTVACFAHRYLNGGSLDSGTLTLSVAAGTYWVSCYVWLPNGFAGTSVILTSNVSIEAPNGPLVDGSDQTVLLPGGGVLGVVPDRGPVNRADLSIQGAWQRIAFRVTYGGSSTLLAQLQISGSSPQTVYSTAWNVNAGSVLTSFVPRVGGAVVVRQINLDQPFITDGSDTYTISVVLPDGTVDNDIPVDGFVAAGATPDYTIVHLGRAIAMSPSTAAEWVIKSSHVAPRQFQVLALSEESRGIFQVTAVSYDPNKFAMIEQGLQFTPANYSKLPELLVAPLPPPTNVAARDYVTGVGVTQTIRATVSWTSPLDPRIDGFQIFASATDFFQQWAIAFATSYDIDGLAAGADYTFGVRSVGRDGKTSAWATTSAPLTVDGKVDVPTAPPSLTAVGGVRRIFLNWGLIDGRRDILQYEVWRSSNTNGPGSGATKIGTAASTAFVDADSETLLPATTWYYWVRGIALGTPLVPGVFAGPVSATTSLLVAADLQDGIINTAKFASSLTPILTILSTADPGTEGAIAFNRADGQLYQYKSGAWAKFLDLGSMTGQVSDAQIAAISAIKITGQISGVQIGDDTIAARHMQAQSVTSLALAAGSVVAGKLAADAATLGTVAANAITSREIAAGEVRAVHLASETLITEAAQLGTAVVQSAQIADLSVGTIHIADSAVTVIEPVEGGNDVSVAVPTVNGKPTVLILTVDFGGSTAATPGDNATVHLTSSTRGQIKQWAAGAVMTVHVVDNETSTTNTIYRAYTNGGFLSGLAHIALTGMTMKK